MSMVAYDPFRAVRVLQGDINRLFERDFARELESYDLMADWTLRVDIKEDAEQVMIRADVPGMEQKDIQVNIEHHILTISGERKFEAQDKRKEYTRQERIFGRFSRSFQLPNTVDAEKVAASYKNGVLEIILPKLPQTKPRAIEIKVH